MNQQELHRHLANMMCEPCILVSLVSFQVRNVFPQYYGDWPPVFGSWMCLGSQILDRDLGILGWPPEHPPLGLLRRQWIDNFFDGFIASNTSVLEELSLYAVVVSPKILGN